MKKIILFLSLLLVFLTPCLTRAQISVRIEDPFAPFKVNNDLYVNVSVTSTYSIAEITATVNDRTISLVKWSGNFYSNRLNLAGLPQGVLSLNIFVKDVLGNTFTKNQVINFDSLPTIAVEYPVTNSVFQSKVRIMASVTDPGNTTCTGKVEYGTSNFTFINSIDTLVNVLPSETTSGLINLTFTAIDNANQKSTSKVVPVYVDTSPFLKPYFTTENQIIDFKDSRILSLEKNASGLPKLKIIDAFSGSIENINLGPNTNLNTFTSGILVDGGAALVLNYGSSAETDTLYVWKNNVLNNISKGVKSYARIYANLTTSLGNHLVWNIGLSKGSPELYITDLTTLTSKLISNAQINPGTSYIGNNGVVAFSRRIILNEESIYKYDIAASQVSTVIPYGYNRTPATDQDYIVYVSNTDTYREVRLKETSKDLLLAKSFTGKFKLNNGYIAYGKHDASSLDQIWTKTPGDVYTQHSFFSSHSTIDELANNGGVVFTNSNSRYYADNSTPFKKISGSLGEVRYTNNNFYLILGSSIFRYDLQVSLAPAISSYNPSSAGSGASVTIKGINFTGASSVSFGGIPATSYVTVSDSLIVAVVGVGASGNVSVSTPHGTTTLAGFTYVSIPVITAAGPVNILSGSAVDLLTTASGVGYTYQWLKDGENINGANMATYTANQTGSYQVKITLNGVSQVSKAISVNVTFMLAATNFKFTNTSATCKGSYNGSIAIQAVQIQNYEATINGTGMSANFRFTNSLNINNLAAGTYEVCISITGQSGYQQCFTSVISEPKDFSIYTSLIKGTNQALLSLEGGETYYINLNGVVTSTTSGQITLSLKNGSNTLSVTTNKTCQGIVSKELTLNGDISVYPNPFINRIKVNLGNLPVKRAKIQVYNVYNKMIIAKEYGDKSGEVEVYLGELPAGLYILRTTADQKITTSKIIKN